MSKDSWRSKEMKRYIDNADEKQETYIKKGNKTLHVDTNGKKTTISAQLQMKHRMIEERSSQDPCYLPESYGPNNIPITAALRKIVADTLTLYHTDIVVNIIGKLSLTEHNSAHLLLCHNSADLHYIGVLPKGSPNPAWRMPYPVCADPNCPYYMTVEMQDGSKRRKFIHVVLLPDIIRAAIKTLNQSADPYSYALWNDVDDESICNHDDSVHGLICPCVHWLEFHSEVATRVPLDTDHCSYKNCYCYDEIKKILHEESDISIGQHLLNDHGTYDHVNTTLNFEQMKVIQTNDFVLNFCKGINCEVQQMKTKAKALQDSVIYPDHDKLDDMNKKLREIENKVNNNNKIPQQQSSQQQQMQQQQQQQPDLTMKLTECMLAIMEQGKDLEKIKKENFTLQVRVASLEKDMAKKS